MHRVAFVVATSLALTVQAEARPHSYLRRIPNFQQAMAMVSGDERVVGGRPSGCPNAFCGCEASLYKFGRIISELNLAGNWRRFPRTVPAPGMAAVRSSHVMILQQHVAGDVWYVHDGNSGGHVTREHPRSIAGYTIVDPGSGSVAPSSFAGPSIASSTFTRPSVASSGFTRSSATRRLASASPSHAWKDTQVPIFAN